jgi:Rrf2 family transcriptional regulator, iron-sulfur cluster assembly transcription factor
MQITRAGEYGVLGLMNLARRPAGQVAMIEDVSREENIPKSFLGKIFQNLVKAGIIRSARGAGGGFLLLKRPEEITVLQVIEAIEGKIAIQRCLQEVPDCNQQPGCALCVVFEQAQDQVKEVFSHTNLTDLLKRQSAMPLANRKPLSKPKPALAIT